MDAKEHYDQHLGNFYSWMVGDFAEKQAAYDSFRDYTTPLTGTDRFLPVKSDEQRILTCFLEYDRKTVRVTDLLHERNADGWTQQVSSYEKIRLAKSTVVEAMQNSGLRVTLNTSFMRHLVVVGTSDAG